MKRAAAPAAADGSAEKSCGDDDGQPKADEGAESEEPMEQDDVENVD